MENKPLCKSLEKVIYPDGIYSGTWGGWEVNITRTSICFTVDQGIRTPWYPVTIRIVDGIASIYKKGV